MMETIKLIALDLDGTLLDSQKRLSPRNEQVLLECMRRGIEIVPCTGRIWNGVPDVIRNLPGIHYAITVNGAVLEDVRNHQVLDQHKLSCRQALELLELANQFDTMYDVYINGQGYGEKRFMEHMDHYGIDPFIQQMVWNTRKAVESVPELVQRMQMPVEKINYFFNDQKERFRARTALDARGDVVVSSSFPSNLEINAVGATKGDGILCLAAYLGLQPNQTMGFGDGENDLSMMKQAGIGVAMGNGEVIVKQAADYVTDTNDADGVAKAIEKFVFQVG